MGTQTTSNKNKDQKQDDATTTLRITQTLDTAANPTRLNILRSLREEPHTFTEIAQDLDMDIAGDSGLLGFHLRRLTDRGLVTRKNHTHTHTYTYTITRLGTALLSAVKDLVEIEEEQETMGMIIEEVSTHHMAAIKDFFKEEYGVDKNWLQSVEKTYSLLVSGRHLASENSEILTLVAMLDEKVVGFIGGRLLSRARTDLSLSPEWEKNEELRSLVEGIDLETLQKMSNQERVKMVKAILARVGIGEAEAEVHDWLKAFFAPGHPQPKDAWIDMIWSSQRHERLVKKKLVTQFLERAREKGAWSVQAYLRNPEDVALVADAGFLKADGQLCATYIGPKDVLRQYKLMYGIRVGSSPLRWDFTHDKQYQSVKLTETIGGSEGGISLALDTTQLYEKGK